MRNKRRRAREIEQQVNHTSAACTGLKIKPHALGQKGQQKSSTNQAMNYALEYYAAGKASISQLGQTANQLYSDKPVANVKRTPRVFIVTISCRGHFGSTFLNLQDIKFDLQFIIKFILQLQSKAF